MLRKRHWLLVPVLGVVPLFFVGGPDWLSPPLYRAAWSQGHIIFFALLALWLGAWVRLDSPLRWLALTLAVFAGSLIIEGIQSQIGRDANWNDVLRNLIGTWLGLFWSLRADWRVWLGRLLATALLCWQLFGLSQVALEHLHRQQQFPVLADFESARDLSSWSGSIERVREPVIEGSYSLAIYLDTRRFSGVDLVYLREDWSGYRHLRFSLYNPEPDELALTLRINDRQHNLRGHRFSDRFNHRLLARAGWNHYRIPLDQVRAAPDNRAMDMGRIQHLGIFASRLERERIIYLDDMRLE